MQRCQLLRVKSGDDGTFGLFQAPISIYHTAELPWKNNQEGISCIPDGTYICKWIKTPKHPDGVYEITNVPNRVAVEIHSGNYAGDTSLGYISNVEGCVLLGLSKDVAQVGQLAQEIVTESRDAIAKFEKEMNEYDFELLVSCQPGLGPFVVTPS